MDKFEKGIIAASIVISMVLFFSVLVARSSYKADVPECIPADNIYTEGKAVMLDKNTWQLYYVARMWLFDPAEVEIPVGSEVDLYVTSPDVVHGFNIASKNVNMMAVPGAITKTTVTFDKPGEYPITCHEYCGMFHQIMQGKIIVR